MNARRQSKAKKVVVVIEDDPLVLEATTGLLHAWGYQVIAAASRDVAMRMLVDRGTRPDLIVCDYHLECEATGVDAIETLRSAFEIPALLISGDVNSPPCSRPGGYQVLHKPLTADSLRAALVEVTASRD